MKSFSQKERTISMARPSRSLRNPSLQRERNRERAWQQKTVSHKRRSSTGSSALNWGIPLLVGIIAVLALAVCCLGIGSGAASTSSASPQTSGATQSSNVQASSAPDFSLSLLGGKTFHLAQARGHPVVLYFMATTCATCAQGSQQLAQVMQTAHEQGAIALAIDVNSGDRPADLQNFVQSVGEPAATTLQWGIDTNDAIATAYQVQTLETMVVINAQGQIIASNSSPFPPAQLVALLKSAA